MGRRGCKWEEKLKDFEGFWVPGTTLDMEAEMCGPGSATYEVCKFNPSKAQSRHL